MHIGRVRTILWASAGLGTAGAALALLAAVTLPLDAPVPGPARAPGSAAASGAATRPAATVPPLASFKAAWAAPLRRPLVDPPKVAAKAAPVVAPAPARPPVMIRLIGTIVDGDRPRGVFAVGLAGVELKAAGEKAGGADVLRVDADAATLSYAGQTFTLKREKTSADPPPTAARPATGTDGGS